MKNNLMVDFDKLGEALFYLLSGEISSDTYYMAVLFHDLQLTREEAFSLLYSNSMSEKVNFVRLLK